MAPIPGQSDKDNKDESVAEKVTGLQNKASKAVPPVKQGDNSASNSNSPSRTGEKAQKETEEKARERQDEKSEDENKNGQTVVKSDGSVESKDDSKRIAELEAQVAQLKSDNETLTKEQEPRGDFHKTPAELSQETPAETKARYGVDDSISDEIDKDPNVQVYKDTHVYQVPSSTHLHPDVAKDMQNRGITEATTESGVVRRVISEQVFAGNAEFNDKF